MPARGWSNEGPRMASDLHPSDSSAQQDAEAVVLAGVSKQFGIDLERKVRVAFGDSVMEIDGATEDESVLVEVLRGWVA